MLDNLLEDGRFDIEGLSGTSAGGMNAVALAQGMIRGGLEGAREEMKRFWRKIADGGLAVYTIALFRCPVTCTFLI